ncbi:MAG: hypothetical protein ACFBZ8_05030 [Opitutales bacterium]
MNRLVRKTLLLLFAASALAAASLLSGCATADPDYSQIPHSRPAGFESSGPAGIGSQGRGF